MIELLLIANIVVLIFFFHVLGEVQNEVLITRKLIDLTIESHRRELELHHAAEKVLNGHMKILEVMNDINGTEQTHEAGETAE